MSDRTEVTDPAVTDGTAADGRPAEAGPGAKGPTRADRVMGRVREGASGRGPTGPGGPPTADGPAAAPAGERPERAEPTGQPSQRATPVAGAASTGAAAGRGGSRPTDGWGRPATGRPGASPLEDDSPTRVNPAVSGPAAAAGRGSGPTGAGSGARTSPAAAKGERGTSGEDETTRTIAGTGALGAVTSSMEEPTQPVPTAASGTGTASRAKDTLTTDAKPAAARGASRKARRARLRLSRIDPWSVMKTSFLFSIALGIAGWVLVAFVWWIIQQSGLFGAVNAIVADMFSAPGDADPFRLEAYVNGSRVLGLTALLAVVDVLLITAISTVASFLYNLSATMLGGLQVTLAETDD